MEKKIYTILSRVQRMWETTQCMCHSDYRIKLQIDILTYTISGYEKLSQALDDNL